MERASETAKPDRLNVDGTIYIYIHACIYMHICIHLIHVCICMYIGVCIQRKFSVAPRSRSISRLGAGAGLDGRRSKDLAAAVSGSPRQPGDEALSG